MIFKSAIRVNKGVVLQIHQRHQLTETRQPLLTVFESVFANVGILVVSLYICNESLFTDSFKNCNVQSCV